MPQQGNIISLAAVTTSYPAAGSPQVVKPTFHPKTITFVVTGTAGDSALVSVDGVKDAAALVVGASGPVVLHTDHISGLWFKASAGNAAAVVIGATLENW